MTDDPSAARVAEVWQRLARVTDPELDEPVTELGFVTAVTLGDGDRVDIGFRLPTYWCAANFAFIMADDMRREVAALSWVRTVGLVLDAHMYADEVNRGMAEGLSFEAAFGAEATGDLDAVRRIFQVKSFQRRQEGVLRHLLAAGLDGPAVLALTLAALRAVPLSTEGEALVSRYLERRDVPGAAGPDDPAFVDEHGGPIPADGLPDYLRRLRRVTINTEFNGALCRGLLAERYPEPAEGSEPTLLDFIRAVPSPGDAMHR